LLSFTIHFKYQTEFSLRQACDLYIVGADFDDVKNADCEIIREYMKPIPR